MSDFGISAGQLGGFGFSQFGGYGEGFGCGGAGGSNATYSFAPPTGTAIGSTLTETITNGSHTTTIVYTETQAATGSTPAQFQITPPATVSAHETAEAGVGLGTNIQPTYSFVTGSNGTTNVIETVTTASATTTLTYTGGTQLSDTLVTITNPSATTANGATLTYNFASPNSVTETFTNGSVSHTETTVNQTAVFTPTASGETEVFASGNAVQTITYAAVNGSPTNFVVASTETSYIPQGSATTPLSVSPGDRAEFSISSSSTTVTPINSSGTALTSFTAPASTTFAVVTPTTIPTALVGGSFVEETITHGTHSNSVLFYSASGSTGIYTEVAHGATIDVTGVAAQLAQLPTNVLGLL